MSARPAVRPRPLGGFNQGMGGGFDEHLEENAFQSAVTQKMLSQQGTSSAQQTTGGSALGSPAGGTQGANPFGQTGATPTAPREVGTIQEELINRPAQDIANELKAFFDINKILGIHTDKDDPQTQARKKQMLSRWNNLNTEQQEYARQKYQMEMKKKQQLEQEKQMKEQQQRQQDEQTIEVPSSTKKGPQGPAAKKPKAVQKLEQNRKTLGGPQSVN